MSASLRSSSVMSLPRCLHLNTRRKINFLNTKCYFCRRRILGRNFKCEDCYKHYHIQCLSKEQTNQSNFNTINPINEILTEYVLHKEDKNIPELNKHNYCHLVNIGLENDTEMDISNIEQTTANVETNVINPINDILTGDDLHQEDKNIPELNKQNHCILLNIDSETDNKMDISNIKQTTADVETNVEKDLQRSLEKIRKLPVSFKRVLKKERLLRRRCKKERNALLKDVNQLKTCLESTKRNDKNYEEVKKQNIQLRAMVGTLKDALEENERLYKERAEYLFQSMEQLDTVREEATKKFNDLSASHRIKLAENIQKLEQQLVERKVIAYFKTKKTMLTNV